MSGRGRIGRAALPLLVVVAPAAAAALGAALLVGDANVKLAPGLAIAVFGTFLTSMAIIVAFSIEERSRWPTPWEMLGRAHVPLWFLIAMASVVMALLSAEAEDSFLSSLSLTLALVSIPLATWSLWRLIWVSSDRGRWALVVDLLAHSILAGGRTGAPRTEPDLGDFDTEDHVPANFLGTAEWHPPRHSGVSIDLVPNILREYADRGDVEAIVRLVDEVHAGAAKALQLAGPIDLDAYLRIVDELLWVQRRAFAELATRVLAGQLGEDAAAVALTRSGEAVIDVAGRARQSSPAAGDAERRRTEALIARHLTALSRIAGAMTHRGGSSPAGDGGALGGGFEQARLKVLRETCTGIQQAVRWAVDADPPGMKLAPDHPWRAGLADPESALVWLWSAAESPTGPYGVGLYALCQILTGRKFFGSYWDGLDIFTEVEARLYGAEEHAPAGRDGRAAIERAGGLPRLSLELAATRLAALPARAGAAPTAESARREERLLACNLFLAGGGYKPAGRDPLADLAWLLTDRCGDSLWTTVAGQLSRLQDPVVNPPLRPLSCFAPACALAICLRLTPIDEAAAEEELSPLRAFIAALPPALLERCAELALALTEYSAAGLPADRDGLEGALVAATRTVCRIVPGPPPRQPAGLSAAAAESRDDFGPGAPPAHVEALRRLSGPGTGPLEIDLIQLDRRWLREWAPLRAALDAALLAAALGRGARVRRIVLFDLPADAGPGATRLHYRWTAALSSAVSCFEGEADPGGCARGYEVRQLVLSGTDAEPPLPADRIVIRDGEEVGRGDRGPGQGFEEAWSWVDRGGRLAEDRLGLIELNGGGWTSAATGAAG